MNEGPSLLAVCIFSSISENQALLGMLSDNDTFSSVIGVLIIGQLFSVINTHEPTRNYTALLMNWSALFSCDLIEK